MKTEFSDMQALNKKGGQHNYFLTYVVPSQSAKIFHTSKPTSTKHIYNFLQYKTPLLQSMSYPMRRNKYINIDFFFLKEQTTCGWA